QEEARRHFNCSYLEGAEVEDQGEDGTRLTHWEKRLFENEAMTGTHTQNPVYSRITLALMEDTGWYLPNYDQAQPLKWGHNLGCDFALKSCKDWIDSRRARGVTIHPFCDKVKKDPLETECTESRDSVALCNLVDHGEELEPVFQVCNCRHIHFFLRRLQEDEKNFALEYYGPGSKCFNHNKEMWEERTCHQ
ncbi:unnamed protein product, partial [Ixodes pacificus]